MPNLTSYAGTLRRGAYTASTFASVLPYTVVMVGAISATPTFPALTVAYTVTSGSYSAVQKDQLVVVYDSTGRKKGSTRVAYGTVTATSLPIAETSANVIDFVTGDTFKVFEAYEIRDKLVSATSQFLKDSRIALGSNTSNPPPVANAGGLWAGFVDDGEDYATVQLNAYQSFAIDTDSTGALTYSWDVDDGTITTGSTSTSLIVVQFPVGFRHISLTVTDSSNSVSHTKRVPVWVHDYATYPPLSIIVSDLHSTIRDGWNATFELPIADESHLDNLPDGAFIVIWEVERYNGAITSIGNAVTNRSHIKAALYLVKDSIRIDAFANTVVFEAISPLAIMRLTPALAQLMVYQDSPTAWSEIRGLTINRMFHYLAYWHSTVLEYFDFVWVSGKDYSYARLSVESGSLADQLQDIASSINANVTCDMVGTIRIINDPNYLSINERDERTTTYALTDADVISVDMTREHRGKVKHVRGEGLSGDTTVAGTMAVFSNAGNAPAWMGVGYETLAKQVLNGANAQVDLNQRTGLHFAKVNGLYEGQFVPQGVKITLPDGYHVFDPALCEFLTFTLASTTNIRGVSFDTGTRWLIEDMSVQYDEVGNKSITLTISHETFGANGVAYYPPTSDASIPPYTPPPPPVYTPPPSGIIGLPPTTTPPPTMAYVTANLQLARTSTFDTASPTWEVLNIQALSGWAATDSTEACTFVVDMASPYYTNTGTAVNGWLCTDKYVMVINNIFGTPTISNTVSLNSGSSTRYRSFHVERLRPHFAAIASRYSDGTVMVAVTTNGTTWTEALVTDGYDVAVASVPSVYVDHHTPTTLYVSVHRDGITTSDVYRMDAVTVYVSTDGGATWSEYYTPRLAQGVAPSEIIKPYTDFTRLFYGVNKFGNPANEYSKTYGTFIDPDAGRSTWSMYFDFKLSPCGFREAHNTLYGVSWVTGKWVYGQGWVATRHKRPYAPYVDGKSVGISRTWDVPVDFQYWKVTTEVVAKTGFPIGGANPSGDPYASPRYDEYSESTWRPADTTTAYSYLCDYYPFIDFSLPENDSVYLAITSLYYEGSGDDPFAAYRGQAGGGLAWRKGSTKSEISPVYQYSKYIPNSKPRTFTVADNNPNVGLLCAQQLNPDFDFEYGSKGWRAGNSYTNWTASLDAGFPYGGFKPAASSTCWIRYQVPADMTILGIRVTVFGVVTPNEIIISPNAGGTSPIETFTDTTGSVLWTDSTVGDVTMLYVSLAESAVETGTYIHLKFENDGADTTSILHVQFVSDYNPDKYGVFMTSNAGGTDAVWSTITTPAASVVWREGYLQTISTGIVWGINGKIGRLASGSITDKTGDSTAEGDVIGVCGK